MNIDYNISDSDKIIKLLESSTPLTYCADCDYVDNLLNSIILKPNSIDKEIISKIKEIGNKYCQKYKGLKKEDILNINFLNFILSLTTILYLSDSDLIDYPFVSESIKTIYEISQNDEIISTVEQKILERLGKIKKFFEEKNYFPQAFEGESTKNYTKEKTKEKEKKRIQSQSYTISYSNNEGYNFEEMKLDAKINIINNSFYVLSNNNEKLFARYDKERHKKEIDYPIFLRSYNSARKLVVPKVEEYLAKLINKKKLTKLKNP